MSRRGKRRIILFDCCACGRDTSFWEWCTREAKEILFAGITLHCNSQSWCMISPHLIKLITRNGDDKTKRRGRGEASICVPVRLSFQCKGMASKETKANLFQKLVQKGSRTPLPNGWCGERATTISSPSPLKTSNRQLGFPKRAASSSSSFQISIHHLNFHSPSPSLHSFVGIHSK